MLDLEARVHLDEVELAVLVQELRPCRAPRYWILRMAAATSLADLLAARRVERGRGRFFEDLLVAALQRAVALAQMHGIAPAVAEDLDLDVARLL